MAFPEPSERKATIYVTVYPSADKFYDIRSYTFDQFTLKQIPGRAVFDEPYAKADFGDKLRRMNYDIHVGSILGLPGKVLAFFVSLIGASLPITGFIIWWGKRPKKKKKDPKAKSKPVAAGDGHDKPKPVFKPGGNRPDKTPKPQEPIMQFSPMANVSNSGGYAPYRPVNNSASTSTRNGQTD